MINTVQAVGPEGLEEIKNGAAEGQHQKGAGNPHSLTAPTITHTNNGRNRTSVPGRAQALAPDIFEQMEKYEVHSLPYELSEEEPWEDIRSAIAFYQENLELSFYGEGLGGENLWDVRLKLHEMAREYGWRAEAVSEVMLQRLKNAPSADQLDALRSHAQWSIKSSVAGSKRQLWASNLFRVDIVAHATRVKEELLRIIDATPMFPSLYGTWVPSEEYEKVKRGLACDYRSYPVDPIVRSRPRPTPVEEHFIISVDKINKNSKQLRSYGDIEDLLWQISYTREGKSISCSRGGIFSPNPKEEEEGYGQDSFSATEFNVVGEEGIVSLVERVVERHKLTEEEKARLTQDEIDFIDEEFVEDLEETLEESNLRYSILGKYRRKFTRPSFAIDLLDPNTIAKERHEPLFFP